MSIKKTEEQDNYPFLLDIGIFSDSMDGIIADLPKKTVLDIGLELYDEEFSDGVPLMHGKGSDLVDIHAAAEVYNALCALEGDSNLPEKFRAACNELRKASGKDEVMKALTWNDKQSPLSAYFAWRAIAVQLEGMREKVAEWSSGAWHRGYCPICGMEPVSARLKKSARGSLRYLTCGACRTEWEYKRIGCPYCGTEEQEKLKILEVENEDSLRVDTCDECSSYIKTYVGDESGYGSFCDLKTLHVDILCGETKYKKHGGFFIAR